MQQPPIPERNKTKSAKNQPIPKRESKATHESTSRYDPASKRDSGTRSEPEDINALEQTSVRKCRHSLFGFLALLFYVLLMSLAISDKDLLLGHSSQETSFLYIGIPLIVWSCIIPLLLFISHIGLLFNLNEHLNQLVAWREANEGQLNKDIMQLFFYDLAFAYHKETWIGLLLDWFVWLTIYLLPLSTLLIILILFGAYQNMLASSLHFMLVILDAAVYWKFYSAWKKAQAVKKSEPIQRYLIWIDRFKIQIPWALSVLVCLWLMLSGRLDGGFFEANESWLHQPLNIGWYFTGFVWVIIGICFRTVCYHLILWSALVSLSLTAWFSSAWQLQSAQILINNTNNSYLGLILPRLVVKNSFLVSLADEEKRILEMTSDYHETHLTDAIENNRKNEIARQWRLHGSRQDWRRRSFNFADLSGSYMERADFELAHIEAGILSTANLRGASFLGADLRDTKFNQAQLQAASFYQTRLQGVDFSEAQMQGAQFNHAQMQGALLIKAGLQTADFSKAQMQGTHLNSAQLQAANFSETQLQGANLSDAQMQGIIFKNTQMQGVSCNDIDHFDFMQRQGLTDDIDSCRESGAFEPLTDALAKQLASLIPEEKQDQFNARIGIHVDLEETICGTLSEEMVQIITAHWFDSLPIDDIKHWYELGYSCS